DRVTAGNLHRRPASARPPAVAGFCVLLSHLSSLGRAVSPTRCSLCWSPRPAAVLPAPHSRESARRLRVEPDLIAGPAELRPPPPPRGRAPPRHLVPARVALSGSGLAIGRLHSYQVDAEVAQPVQQPVEVRLVTDLPDEDGQALSGFQLHPVEGGLETIIQPA